MESIEHSQVLELVEHLPKDKLPRALLLLQELAYGKGSGSDQLAFLQHSLVERRRRLAEQALEMRAFYEQTTEDRQLWQSGEFQHGD